MQANLSEELDLLDLLVKHHLKSYQVWCAHLSSALAEKQAPENIALTTFRVSDRQHRRTIVLALNDPSRELEFTAKALALDAKNYHTWAYRQWVLMHFWPAPASSSAAAGSTGTRSPAAREVWDGEIAYADKLLQEDLRNNSAWSHRFFVAFESGMGGDCAEREIR